MYVYVPLFLQIISMFSFVLGFEVGKQYVYELESRTLTSLNQDSANQYTGVVITGRVMIHVKSQNVVILQVQTTYACPLYLQNYSEITHS